MNATVCNCLVPPSGDQRERERKREGERGGGGREREREASHESQAFDPLRP